MHQDKCVIASCVSGMCNALSTLVTSTIVAKHLGRHLHVYWIDGFISNDVQLNDIFNISIHNSATFLNTEEYGKMCDSTTAIRFCDPYAQESDFKNNAAPGPILRIFNYNNLSDINNIETIDERDIFICEPHLAPFVKPSDLKTFFDLFLIKSEHLQIVHNFIYQHQCIMGIHIRGTDILENYQMDLSDIKMFVEHKIAFSNINYLHGTRPFFICSDDSLVEDMFRDNDLVAMMKKEYVVKRDNNQSWLLHSGSLDHVHMAKDLEYNGKLYKPYYCINMVRTKNQVIGAWIDLLTLAHLSQIDGFVTSQGSTYYAFAKIMHEFLHQTSLIHKIKSVIKC